MSKIEKLVNKALAEGKPSGWFESVYQQANQDPRQIPWANLTPHPLLVDWLNEVKPDGRGKQALVIGCGLGDDCEVLSQVGFTVTAFDVSSTAITWCRQRFPASEVNYQVADLLDLPLNWRHQFDLVVEVRTIQSLPIEIRDQVLEAIAALIKPEGLLFLVTNFREENQPRSGPPWAMSESELQRLETFNLSQVQEIKFPSLVRIIYQKVL